jgi:hypothetical protein
LVRILPQLFGSFVRNLSAGLGNHFNPCCTDKKEKKIFLIYREIQSGAVAKSYIRNGFQIYEEMQKYFPIYEEAVSHI